MMCIALVFTLTHALAGEFVLVVIRIDKWHYFGKTCKNADVNTSKQLNNEERNKEITFGFTKCDAKFSKILTFIWAEHQPSSE